MSKKFATSARAACTGVLLLSPVAVAVPVATATAATSAFAGLEVDTTQAQPALCSSLQGTTMSPAIRDLPDGGVSYDYEVDGATVSFPVPPTGFSPLTAPDSQLIEYGFPARPSDASELSIWTADMQSYKAVAAPSYCSTNRIVPATVGTTGTEAGYLAPRSSTSFVAVEGDFIQPHHYSSCSGSYEVSWTGIGGFASGDGLLQTGTDLNNGSPYAWYDWLDNTHSRGEQPMPNVTVHVGDSIHTYVSYQSSNLVANFYVADNTTGTSDPVVINNVPTSYYDGRYAESIDERPFVGSSFAPLANFRSIAWSNVRFENTAGNWHPIGYNGNFQEEIMQTGSTVRAEPTALNADQQSYTDNYKHC